MRTKYVSKRPCPVCKSSEGSIISRLCYALFDDLEIPGNKILVQCNICGMLFDDINFSESQLQEYYRRNGHYAVSSAGGAGSISNDNKARYDRIIELLEIRSDGGMVVDFGCGQGGFVSTCLKYGFDAIGIEPSVKSREKATKGGTQTYESFDRFIRENSEFKIQAIVFSHVLEHLINPAPLIQYLKGYAKDVLVYIEVPDADSYLLSNNIRWHEMYFEHLSHFSRYDLLEFARRNCIEILKSGNIPFSKLQKDISCNFILGRFTEEYNLVDMTVITEHNNCRTMPIPCPDIKGVLQAKNPLALWGISQYAMLLLGNFPNLSNKMLRLFDTSPSKIGRSIQGIVIESSTKINTLPDNFTLLIPKSIYLKQMLKLLNRTDFSGEIIEI